MTKYIAGFFSIALIVILVFFPSDTMKEVPLETVFDPIERPYTKVLPAIKPVRGVPGKGMRAEDCGSCHQKIYSQWRKSTHAYAMKDPQFLIEMIKPESPSWLCLNCHAPIENQRQKVAVGLINGKVLQPIYKRIESFDKKFRYEGVTCAVCHVRTDPISKESYIRGPYGSEHAPHPVKKEPDQLRNTCERCHNPQGEAITENLVCWFKTTEEFQQASALLGKGRQKVKYCSECHMPSFEGRLSVLPGTPVRKYRQHFFTGGGIMKTYELYSSGSTATERHNREKLMFPPPKVFVSWNLEKRGSAVVSIINDRALHHLPTGDPERYIVIFFFASDSTGNRIYFRRYRIGQTWQWSPAKKIGDNRLKAGETRVWHIVIPADIQSKASSYSVQVLSVKVQKDILLTLEKYARYFSKDSPDWPNLKRSLPLSKRYPVARYLFREDYAQGQVRKFLEKELLFLTVSRKDKPVISWDE